MLHRPDVNGHFPPVPLNSNRDPVAGCQKERSVDDILGRRDFDPADSGHNVAFLQARLRGRRVFGEFRDPNTGYVSRTVLIFDIRADPAMSDLSKADVVHSDLFGRLDRQSVTGASSVNARNHDSDHLAFEIHERRAAESWFDRNDRPNMCGHEISAKKLAIEPSDYAETRCGGQIDWKADRHYRRG